MHNIAGRSKDKSKTVPVSELRERVVRECRSKLTCWMGERYLDVMLMCLNLELEDGIGQSLNGFYLEVVLTVTQCVPAG